MHHTHVVTAGRNGLTVVQGARVLAEDNDYDKVGYVTFDDEPNFATEASRDITFRNNTAGTWGLAFVSIDGGERGAPINRIIITGNVTTGKAMYVDIDNGGAVMMKNIVFSNNRSSIAASGPRLIFARRGWAHGDRQPATHYLGVARQDHRLHRGHPSVSLGRGRCRPGRDSRQRWSRPTWSATA